MEVAECLAHVVQRTAVFRKRRDEFLAAWYEKAVREGAVLAFEMMVWDEIMRPLADAPSSPVAKW